jgi:putative ABC transport system permease protein
MRDGRSSAQIVEYYHEAMRQIRELPGVNNVALTTAVPWRDRGEFNLEFSLDRRTPATDDKQPRANLDVVSPGFFTTLGVPLIAGRDFNDADRDGSEPVAIVSQSLAEQMFPNGDALNHHLAWTDPVLKFATHFSFESRRIVGIVADIDNREFVPRKVMAVYHPVDQEKFIIGSRILLDARSDPYALVQPITRIFHQLSADQPVERARTLEDIKAEVLSPERLNAVVSGVFAGVALLIAVVGVGGVLAFSVSGRTREFGIRLAVGAAPRDLLMRVITEGAAIAVAGLVLGLVGGYWLARLAGSLLGGLKMPGAFPVASSALVLLLAAVTASAIPALRAARVDVMQALRSE